MMSPPPRLALDHLVVAARTLEEGAAWLEERTGVPTVSGGKHARMGTHNRLLSLGDGLYLEIIAIDPQAPAPGRPRWFALDSPAMRMRLESGPALVHWVARTLDIDAARAAFPALVGDVLEMERGDYRWRIGVPSNGALPAEGAFPTLIEWQGARHPTDRLPRAACRLEGLTVRGPDAARHLECLQRLGLSGQESLHFVEAETAALSAVLRTPRGVVLLPEQGRNSRVASPHRPFS